MKRLFASILTIILLFSCDISDDSNNVYYEFVPINAIDMPTELELNQVYEINLTYERLSSCHVYHNIYYNHESAFERTVSVICSVYENNNCEPLDDPNYDVSFNFMPTNVGTYTFYFWQGEDENGESQFITVEATVTE